MFSHIPFELNLIHDSIHLGCDIKCLHASLNIKVRCIVFYMDLHVYIHVSSYYFSVKNRRLQSSVQIENMWSLISLRDLQLSGRSICTTASVGHSEI